MSATAPPEGPWVVGLDLSLQRTGIAYANGDVAVVPTGALRGMARIEVIVGRVSEALDCWDAQPDLVVIESYTYATTHSAHVLGELGGIVRWTLHGEGVRWLDVAPGKLKIYATGDGNAKKTPIVIAARERLGMSFVTDDDQADAVWLRALGLDLLGAPLVDLPQIHRRALKGVELPAVKP